MEIRRFYNSIATVMIYYWIEIKIKIKYDNSSSYLLQNTVSLLSYDASKIAWSTIILI